MASLSSRVISLLSQTSSPSKARYVRPAGLTASNWNVSANIIGTGTIKTLRISAYSNTFTPLNGSGTLFELIMRRVSSTVVRQAH